MSPRSYQIIHYNFFDAPASVIMSPAEKLIVRPAASKVDAGKQYKKFSGLYALLGVRRPENDGKLTKDKFPADVERELGA